MSEGDDLPDRLYSAINRRDIETVTALMADGASWEVIPFQRPYADGAAGATAQLQFLLSISSDFSITLMDIHFGDGTYTVEWEADGTNDGDYEPFGLEASGKHFYVKGVTVLVTEGVKIKAARNYYDLWGFFAQVGLPRSGPLSWPLVRWTDERAMNRPAAIE